MCAFSRNSVFGRVTWTRLRFDSFLPVVSVAVSFGWPPRRVGAPENFSASFGFSASASQFAAANGTDGVALAPPDPPIDAATLMAVQAVGLSVKFGRSILIWTSL